MFNFLHRLFSHRHKWVLRATVWPYPYEEAWYCRGCKTVIPRCNDEPAPAPAQGQE